MTDRHVRRTGDDYVDALAALLPTGPAWPREADTALMALTGGQAQIWGDVDGRAADLLERESDPRLTIELLPDWERAFGLPDPCYTAPQTIGQRHLALMMRMTMIGSQSREFFIGVAAMIGYTITITEYRVFVVGLDGCGDCRVYGDGTDPMYNQWGIPIKDVRGNNVADGELSEWPNYGIGPPENRCYWTVHVDDASLIWFRVTSGQTGVDPHLRIGMFDDLECLLNRWKSAHTEIIFDYSGVNPGIIDAPVISGTTTIGSTLSCTTGNWTNNPTGYTYQWQRNFVDIIGASASTYVVTQTDAGTALLCNVTATNPLGVTTTPSNLLNIPLVAPINTTLPVISGSKLMPGGTLSCTTGSWLCFPTSYTYQWKRGGANISGATASTYLLTPADGSQTIGCAVTAINATGSSSPAASNTLAIGSYATLDGTPANATVSGGGLTATCSAGPTTNSGARSTKVKNSGKWYAEVTFTTLRGDADNCGFAPAATAYTDFASGLNSIIIGHHGDIYCGTGNYIRSLGLIPDGTVVQWCLDLDADIFWVRAGDGYWNGVATDNPATGAGGASCASLSGLTLAPIVGFGGSGSVAGDNVTFNFGATAFAYPVPAGFTAGWTY